MNISPHTDLTYFAVSGHLWFFSCGSQSQISKGCAHHPTVSRYRRCFFLSSAAWYTHLGTLSNSTLYRPTCRHGKENHSWLWQCVARNSSDTPQYQAPLFHNHTNFKCCIAFSDIIRSCDMPPCILFIIHSFLNAWCLIICLSEHRTFAFRLVLDANWSVTNWHWN